MYGNTSLLYESPKNCVHAQSLYKASPQGAGDEGNIVGAYDVIPEWRLVKVSFKVTVDECKGCMCALVNPLRF